MKIVVFGAGGFVGRSVCQALEHIHDVYRVSRNYSGNNPKMIKADLLDPESIRRLFRDVHPDAVVNCAGIVDSSQNVSLNMIFTKNILSACGQSPSIHKIVIAGSAAVYGALDTSQELPVGEEYRLHSKQGYGLSKRQEEGIALRFASENSDVSVVVLRIFNPIGVGMAKKFFVSSLIHQVKAVVEGKNDRISISRLDSSRDYISIEDVADAFVTVIEGRPSHTIYNVGSGKSTFNKEILDFVIKSSKIDEVPGIVETSSTPEERVASQADIGRIKQDLQWQPTRNIEDVIERIVHEELSR